MEYERRPDRIYAESFRIIRDEADLSHLPCALHPLAIRLIHACGMVDVASDLRASDDCLDAGRAALDAGAPILCDAEMVARGIIARALPPGCTPVVTLNDPRTPALAQQMGTTRSAAAVELWRDRLEGAVVVIGNAPTALFHLLDGLQQGWPRPAAVLGFPVGFVGAAESKQALHELAPALKLPYATLLGRRGGSAMAAGAFNAISLDLRGDGT